ncbi:uncharacterized protein N7458_012404 [Penicillium daleae]|uniref:Uncharacterized protein n=1 Tax=Penicillium daleae TaxID=63821 RepID=A0AAD6BVV6_9EURO|nr:uncharacterized protein N7458_012404 [Penicillium daleae]KAJ5433248.1 hypothetical protein N7458_012404 [Penicillium daleae]
MAPKKGVTTSLAEVKNKKPACAECRRRKKRCGHRVDPSASEAMNSPAVAAEAADVPAANVDPPIDVNTAAEILMSMRYGSSVEEPVLEGDQDCTTTASGAESSAVALRDAADHPSERPLKRLRISGPRRPSPPVPAADSAEGAATMAVNTVFARDLAKKLEEFEAKYQASMAAHKAVMEAGKAVKDLVESWVGSWAAGQ